MLRGLLLAFAAVLLGCRPTRGPSAEPTPLPAPACDPEAEPRCGHPVDAVVLPRLQFKAPAEDRGLLCRRLAVDILGRGPTPTERDACEAGETEAIVDAWLATPEHRLLQRRAWAALIDYDAHYVWPPLVDDLDALTDELAADAIGYPEVRGPGGAAPLRSSPATPTRTGCGRSSCSSSGRSARPDEVAALMPLLGIWWSRDFYDRRAPQEYFDEFGFSGCGCAERGGCRSDALGEMVDFGEACDRPARLVDVSPDGARFRSDLVAGAPSDRCPRASPELRKRLHGLSKALAARFDFYEAAVDRELRRYLGWVAELVQPTRNGSARGSGPRSRSSCASAGACGA